MTTANDLITNAYQMARIYAPGETINAADLATGLSVLNTMLDGWSIETLMCFADLEQSGTLVVGQSAYPIGAGAAFNTTRPVKIHEGPGAAYLQDTLGNNYPVDVVSRDKWNMIGNRTVTSNIPDTMFYDDQYPLGIINIFPVPTMSYVLFWDSNLPLTSFASYTQQVSLPQGYQDAIQKSLAVELWPWFKDPNKVPTLLIEKANQAKGRVKRANITPVEAVYDGEIVAKSSSTYNIYRDGRGSGA